MHGFIKSVANRWKASILTIQGTIAEEDFSLTDYQKAVDFCNSELENYLNTNLAWHESETQSGGAIYLEWNYYSHKKNENYKIFQKVDTQDEYNCITLKIDDQKIKPLGEVVVYDELEAAKKYFIDYENN